MQVFKNSAFPPEMVRGLSQVLDDFADQPIIVRSSSLLEDRLELGVLRQSTKPVPRQRGRKQQRLAPRCSTPSQRSMPPRSVPTPSSTASNAASSTPTEMGS